MTRRALTVATAVGGSVLLALLLLPLRSHDVSGIVRAGGEPVAGADVWVFYTSWGIVDRRLVWDRSHVFSAVTGADGRFRITYRGPSNVQLNVRASGYEWFQAWTGGAAQVDADLEPEAPPRRPPAVPAVDMGCDELAVADGRVSVDLGSRRAQVATVAFPADTGLLYPVLEADPPRLVVRDAAGATVDPAGTVEGACPGVDFLVFPEARPPLTVELPDVPAVFDLVVRPG